MAILSVMTALSILDLAPVPEGATPGDALRNSRDLAAHAERWGYTRFWLAEHHNMVGIASAATSVAAGFVLAGTSRIRVGSGGIMLPNHSPLVIAEQFGTLAALYPGRVDLGLGRAPGTDGVTMQALRRGLQHEDDFPRDVQELRALFDDPTPDQRIRAVPGAGLKVPLYILGSSLYGAQLAAMLGLPFAFASHFAPDALMQALAIYRERFEPSEQLDKPHAIVACNVVAADTAAEARRLFTSPQQSFVNLVRGTRGLLRPPIDDIETYWSPAEKAHVSRMLACSFVGTDGQVADRLHSFLAQTKADELIVAAALYDQTARLRSYELLANAMQC
jgi:luciferase family oxidoreductase group 1